MDKIIVAGSGHRPKYFPRKPANWLQQKLEALEEYLTFQDVDHIISGGALGWDHELADMAIKLNIPFKLYLPFSEMHRNWDKKDKFRLFSQMKQAVDIKYAGPAYEDGIFLLRDRMMVDDADVLLALKNPDINHGGTKYTEDYAEARQTKVINFWDK